MLLLHCCCAPCAAPILEYLQKEGVETTIFFFNPNIYPDEEYNIRKGEIMRYAAKLGIDFIDGDYEHDKWLCHVKGHEADKERGARCGMCFYYRLLETAKIAVERGFDTIATTLASSRWKNLEQINKAGNEAVASLPTVKFWANNWRKGGLQERRSALLKENGFYNQLYCGCEFSMRNGATCRQTSL